MNEATEVKRLPVELTRQGNEYRFFMRGNKALIYAEGPGGKDLAYEVFKIKVEEASVKFGKQYPTRERFPGNEAFGSWAWWYGGVNRLERALEKFHELEGIVPGAEIGRQTSRKPTPSEERPKSGHHPTKR